VRPLNTHLIRQRHNGRFGNASPLRRARAERRAFVGYGGERGLPLRVAFDVNGVGRWEQELSISMPDAATIEKILEHGKVHAAIHGGRVVTRGMVEAVAAPDKLSRMISRLR
jgi:hypothetical protein